MSCSVLRNKKGDIIKVMTPDGTTESKVFKQLAALPHLTMEQAVDAYDEVLKLSPEIDSDDIGILEMNKGLGYTDYLEYNGMFSKTTTGLSGYDDILKDDVGGKQGYFFFYKKQKARIQMMSPDQYLKKVRDGFQTNNDENINENSTKSINEGIEKGDKINMPMLNYLDGKFNQEGRNRATVAKQRGEKLIPVMVLEDVTLRNLNEVTEDMYEQLSYTKKYTNEDELIDDVVKKYNLHRDAKNYLNQNSGDAFAYLRFQQPNNKKNSTPKEVFNAVVDKLKQTGLAKSVTILSEQEIADKLQELGLISKIKFQTYKGRDVITVGETNIYYKKRQNPITGENLPGIELDLIETQKEARGKGEARKAMDEFVKYADATNQKVYLVVSPRDNSTTTTGLEKLYQEYGFTKTSDFEMERRPQRVKMQNSTYPIPKGFVVNGEVFLNSDTATMATPIHEFGHLWYASTTDAIRNKGKELIKDTQYLKDVQNSPYYSTLTEEQQLEEALIEAIGDSGAKIIDSNKQDSIKQWLKDLWQSIKDAMGISNYTPEQLENITLEEFTRAVSIDIFNTQNEPNVTIESDGKVYPDFLTALSESDSKTIEVKSNGEVIATLPTTRDERSIPGLINAFIYDGILSQDKVTHKGKTVFKPAGDTYLEQKIALEFFKDAIKGKIPKDSYKIKDGLIEIDHKEIEPSAENSQHRTISDSVRNYFSSETYTKTEDNIDEKNLRSNLYTILNQLGVSVMSMRDYQARFNKKNGDIPPSAEALADIANRVIAFKDGLLPIEELTEEVMHFIVETLPQEQLDELSDFIENSKEYKENAERYREVFKGDEKLIKKEILGQILKNLTLNKVGNKPKNLLEKLVDIIQNFFTNITVTDKHRQDLKNLNGLVNKLIFQQSGPQFDNNSLDKSKEIATFYSLSDSVSSAATSMRKVFQNTREVRQLRSYARELNNSTFEELKGIELEIAITRLLDMTDRLITTTEYAMESANKKGLGLSGQNKAILEDLDNALRKSLVSLSNELSKPQEGMENVSRNLLRERLDENAEKIGKLAEANNSNSTDFVESLAKQVAEQAGRLEDEVFMEETRKAIRGEVKDVNQLFSFFGQLHHASNPILNIIADKIWDMNMRINMGTKEDVSVFMNYMQTLSKDERDQFNRELFDHKRGYMLDMYDQSSFKAVLDIQKMDAYTEITKETIEGTKNITDKYNVKVVAEEMGITIKEVTEKLEKVETYNRLLRERGLAPITDEQRGLIATLTEQKQLPYKETMMAEKYYRDMYNEDGTLKDEKDRTGKFDKIDRLNISGVTQQFLKEMSSQRGTIRAEAQVDYMDVDKDGNDIKKTATIYTPDQKGILTQISNERKSRKSIYSETGLVKTGLKLQSEKPAEGKDSVLLRSGQYLVKTDDFNDLSEAEQNLANISYDLNKMDQDFMDSIESTDTQNYKALNNFVSYLATLSKGSDAISEEIMANVDVSLSQKFYDTLNGESFLLGDTLLKLNPGKEELISSLKDLYAQRNALLSRHRKAGSPFEITELSKSQQQQVRTLSETISKATKNLKLPEREENESAGVKAPNLQYQKDLEKSGLDERTFITTGSHANDYNLATVRKAFYNQEKGAGMTKAELKLVDNYYVEGDLEATEIKYLKDNLHAYYMRFAPIGYKSFEERIKAGENPILILQEMGNREGELGQYLDLRVDSSFDEDSSGMLNPNYNHSYDGGYNQPKKGRFLDKGFIDKFGLDENGNASKNQKLYKARELYLNTRKIGLEKMKEDGYNPYRIIQISATNTEKGKKLIGNKNKLQTAKEWWKDTISYRVDDIAFGEDNFEKTREIPKYYLRDLESDTDVSTDYIYSLVQFSMRANQYEQRKNTIATIDALQDVLINNHNDDRKGKLENTVKMVKSYVDDAMFGAIESRPFKIKIPGRDTPLDITKVVRMLTRFTSLKNLGFNLVIPATSAITAGISKRVEQFIGEKLNTDASKMGNAEFTKLWKDPTKNALDFNDNSKIFLIMQKYGFYGLSEKARNAKYNTLNRTFGKIAMGAHSVSNFAVTPRVVLSILHDNKVVKQEGEQPKIQTRQQFLQEGIRGGQTEAELLAKWRANKDYMYNHMDFTEKGFKWKGQFKDGIHEQTGLSKDYMDARDKFIQNQMGERVSDIEGQMPQGFRLQAQRHALLSTTLLHKSFLAVAGAKRIKDRHYNVSTGMYEEGTWRTAADVMGEFFSSDIKGADFKARVQRLKDSMKIPDKPVREDFDEGEKGTAEYKEAVKNHPKKVLEAELRNRNKKRLSIELGSYMGLALILTSAMFMIDDDEDDNAFAAMSNLLMMRTLNESASNLSFNIIGDVGDTIESPVVIYNNAAKMSKVWEAFDFREIESGRYRGMNRNTRYLMNLTPGAKSIYDMSSAKNLNEARGVYELHNKNAFLNASTGGILPLFDSFEEN